MVLEKRGVDRVGSAAFLGAMVLATFSAGFVGCNQQIQPPPAEEGVTDVAIRDFAFNPKTVTITVGEKVRWTNMESTAILHTTTSGNPGDADEGELWDSGSMSSGGTFTHQFDEVGEFSYFCHLHEEMPEMRDAKVIVEAAGS